MSTTIDVSGVLFAARKNAIEEFEKKVNEGNQTGARIIASEIAGICRQMAKSSPYGRENNIMSAKKWEEISHSFELTAAQISSHPHQKIETMLEGKDDYSKQVEALITKSTVKFSDIGGMERVKQLLMETVVIAGLKKPDAITPWKGILLFGPPGTGKTLLAAASAGTLDASFYDVKTESILSKYFGESSKLITALYNSARNYSPSIVFIDEFDSLSPSRDGEASEASRKVLSTLLTELDGLGDKNSNRLLLTLAATNTPWDLDTAVLSRFPRRIYVPLPDAESTKAIIKLHTKGLDITNVNLENISEKCVEDMFYSGRDLSNFSQQAVWNMVREANPDLYKLAEIPFEKLSQKSLKTRPLCDDDFIEGWKRIKSPLTQDTIERYEQWNSQYGEN